MEGGRNREAMANTGGVQHEHLAQPRAVAGGGSVGFPLEIGDHDAALFPGAQQLGGGQQPFAGSRATDHEYATQLAMGQPRADGDPLVPECAQDWRLRRCKPTGRSADRREGRASTA